MLGYHIFPEHLKGGFIGVDIFFVISGFLISTIIFESLEKGGFSFKEFYLRRIYRIFPALMLILITCIVSGWFLYREEDYMALGKHLRASALFFNNIQLWKESGYFDAEAIRKPLLHLWSLGIEEQFYFIWPIALWFFWRRRLNFISVASLLIIISFAFNLRYLQVDQKAAFYWPHARFWQLIAGAWLARIRLPHQHAVKNLQSVLGFGLILIGSLVIREEKSFPGWWALFPVFGTGLLINATKDGWINRTVLANRTVVWIGLISYPLYLWHWPILSFSHHVGKGMPSYPIRFGIIAGSVVLAWLTYKFIERPIRFGRRSGFKLCALFAAWIFVLIAGVSADPRSLIHILPTGNVVNGGDIGHGYFFAHINKHFYPCQPELLRQTALRCAQSKVNTKIDIAMIGDSHSESIFLGLAEKLRDKNLIYYIKEHDYFLDVEEFKELNSLIKSEDVSTTILAGWWGSRLNDSKAGERRRLKLKELVSELSRSGKRVYFVADDVPTFPMEPTNCKYVGSLEDCSIPRAEYDKVQDTYYPMLKSLAASLPGIKLLEVGKYFCDEMICSMVKDGKLLFRDKGHLNINGTRYLAERIWMEIE